MDLGPHLKLKDVLFVPQLTCSLISVSQLAKDLNCVVTFTDSFCVIQDRISRTLIGVGNVQGGVFLHKVALDVKKQVHAVQTSKLWHRRLGHPSKEVLTLLAKNLDFNDMVGKVDEPCDVCLRAKQTRSPFSQSESNASELFELIHCDIHIVSRLRVVHIIS